MAAAHLQLLQGADPQEKHNCQLEELLQEDCEGEVRLNPRTDLAADVQRGIGRPQGKHPIQRRPFVGSNEDGKGLTHQFHESDPHSQRSALLKKGDKYLRIRHKLDEVHAVVLPLEVDP